MLNPRQRHFAELYAAGKGVREAYVAAGYSDGDGAAPSASRLLKRPDVAAYVADIREEVRSGSVATVRELAEFHTSILRDAEVDPRDRLAAARDLGRHLRYFDGAPDKPASNVQIVVSVPEAPPPSDRLD